MPVDLSRLAKWYIADFANADLRIAEASSELRAIWEVYHTDNEDRRRVPSHCYVATREFELCLNGDSSADSLGYLFTEGPPAWFWYKTPPRLLSGVVEIFLSQHSPTALRQIVCVSDGAAEEPSLMWPEYNVEYFACHLCQCIQTGNSEVLGVERPRPFTDHNREAKDSTPRQQLEAIRFIASLMCDPTGAKKEEAKPLTYIVELSHVRNLRSGQVLTVEMWYLGCASDDKRRKRSEEEETLQKQGLSHAKVYLAECKHAESGAGTSRMPVRSRVVVDDVLLESLKFLERYSLDKSLPLCREWRATIDGNASLLALHPVRAEFKFIPPKQEDEDRRTSERSVTLGDEWQATFTNYSRCFANPDARTFGFRSCQPPEHASGVIHRHLRNAHVQRMQCAVKMGYLDWDVRTLGLASDVFDWSVGMLYGLSKSTTVADLHTVMICETTEDPFKRFAEGLRRRRTPSLTLSLSDAHARILCEHPSFHTSPPILELTSLRLSIYHDQREELVPYWIGALYEWRSSSSLNISYAKENDRDFSANAMAIPRALRQIIEDFEAGRNISVQTFILESPVTLAQCFEGRTPAYRRADCPDYRSRERVRIHGWIAPHYVWDVYYFESPAGEWLTVFANALFLRFKERYVACVRRGKFTDIYIPE